MQSTCFVMTPFGGRFADLYQRVLEPAVRSAGLEPRIGSSSYEPGSIPDQILRDIAAASVAIAVLTEGNGNVFYEMGLAHKGGVPVVALIEAARQESTARLPFDIRHHRVVPYEPTEEGYNALRAALARALPQLHDEHLLVEMLVPPSITAARSVIAAAPLAFRDARKKIGGFPEFRETFADYVGIRGLFRALAMVKGFDELPDLWNPNDFMDSVLSGDERSAPTELTIYSIGSPKVNRFTGLLMRNFFESCRPRFTFVADESSTDLRDVRIALKRDGQFYLEGINPDADDRRAKDIGLVIRGPNPFASEGMMVVMAGRSAVGTEAACRAAVDPKGVKMILQHLQANATARGFDNASLSDHRKAFWAAVTMSATPNTFRPIPASLAVNAAQYFE